MKTEGKNEPAGKFIEDRIRCEICRTARNIRMCSGCQLVGYCSVEHQRQDWSFHKNHCKCMIPYKIMEESNGKYAIAAKDLNKGTVILEENPLIHFNLTGEKFNDEVLQCTACGSGIKIKEDDNHYHRCSTCFWPICNPECEKAPIHAKNECKVLAHLEKSYMENQSTRQFSTVARAFSLRTHDPSTWNEILNILPFTSLDEFTKVEEVTQNILKCGKSLSQIKSEFPNFLEEEDKIVAYEFLVQLTVLARRLGFQVPVEGDPESSHVTLYKQSSHFPNSCRSNCVWNVGSFPDFRLKIRAAVPIKKGEKLTLNRLGYSYFDTRNRQHLFYERFKTYCQCELCSDSQELGTFQSGIVCDNCKTKNPGKKPGYLLPFHPDLNQENPYSENADWFCSVCTNVQPASSFLAKLDQINEPFKDAAKINMKRAFLKWEIMKCLKEERGTYLHPNHWIFQQAFNTYQQLNLFPSWKKDDFEEVKPDIQEKVERLQFLAGILDKTCPGIQPERIRILELLTDGMMSLYGDECEKKNFQSITREGAIQLEAKLVVMLQHTQELVLYYGGKPLERGSEKNVEEEEAIEKLNAGKRLREHVQARIVEFRKDAEEIKDDKIEDWGFRYKKPTAAN